ILLTPPRPPTPTPFPYTTLFRSLHGPGGGADPGPPRNADARPGGSAATRPSCFASTERHEIELAGRKLAGSAQRRGARAFLQQRSEEHTSELQSRSDLVCRLLLE